MEEIQCEVSLFEVFDLGRLLQLDSLALARLGSAQLGSARHWRRVTEARLCIA